MVSLSFSKLTLFHCSLVVMFVFPASSAANIAASVLADSLSPTLTEPVLEETPPTVLQAEIAVDPLDPLERSMLLNLDQSLIDRKANEYYRLMKTDSNWLKKILQDVQVEQNKRRSRTQPCNDECLYKLPFLQKELLLDEFDVEDLARTSKKRTKRDVPVEPTTTTTEEASSTTTTTTTEPPSTVPTTAIANTTETASSEEASSTSSETTQAMSSESTTASTTEVTLEAETSSPSTTVETTTLAPETSSTTTTTTTTTLMTTLTTMLTTTEETTPTTEATATAAINVTSRPVQCINFVPNVKVEQNCPNDIHNHCMYGWCELPLHGLEFRICHCMTGVTGSRCTLIDVPRVTQIVRNNQKFNCDEFDHPVVVTNVLRIVALYVLAD